VHCAAGWPEYTELTKKQQSSVLQPPWRHYLQ